MQTFFSHFIANKRMKEHSVISDWEVGKKHSPSNSIMVRFNCTQWASFNNGQTAVLTVQTILQN